MLAKFLIAVALVVAAVAAAPTAWAECAWVLWTYQLGSMTDAYGVSAAYPSRQECHANVRDFAPVLKQNGYTVTGGGAGGSEVFGSKGNGDRIKYFCLPDTVDQRGPKGK